LAVCRPGKKGNKLEWSIPTDIAVKIVLAVLLGGAIGFEREMHGGSAGLRTHILVCLGALLAMVVGRQIAAGAVHDPGRVAAGVITGIGFLGAGEIIRMQSGVRGLTTAACLWLVAALGITIGVQLYAVSILATVLAIAVLFLLSRLERLLPRSRRRRVIISLQGRPVGAEDIESILQAEGCRIAGQSVEYEASTDTSVLEYSLRVRGRVREIPVVEKIASLDKVKRVSWQ
jgi:putative Mg2+ transporter-C (MgtC) family protein